MAAELHEPSIRSLSSSSITGHVSGEPSWFISAISCRGNGDAWICRIVRNITMRPPCRIASRHASSVPGVSSWHGMPCSHASSISLPPRAPTAPAATSCARRMLGLWARAHACICVPRMVHARSSHSCEL